jgi:hypothetical protein
LVLFLIVFITVCIVSNNQQIFGLGVSDNGLLENISGENMSSSNPQNLPDYTIMIYMVGSNLETKNYEATKDIEEMLNVNINPNKLKLVLQTGGSKAENDTTRKISFSKNQRFYINNHTLQNYTDSLQKPIHGTGALNMGNSTTLADFIQWAQSEFPAKKYGIILWDHGNSLAGFGLDELYHDPLTIMELANAFSPSNKNNDTTRNFEFIGFDACYMASLEVADILTTVNPGFAKYMIASQEIEPNWGWDYSTMLSTLSSRDNLNGSSIGRIIIDSYKTKSEDIADAERFGADREITLSVIDLDKIAHIKKTMDDLVTAFGNQIGYDVTSLREFLKAVRLTEHYGQSGSDSLGIIDLYDFTTNLERAFPIFTKEINAVRDSIKDAVIFKHGGLSKPNANGLSIYLPSYPGEYNNTNAENAISEEYFKTFIMPTSLIVEKTPYEERLAVKSEKRNSNVTIHTNGFNIANAYAEIITSSSKDSNSKIRVFQSINHSSIDNKGFFHYNTTKILSLCNERHDCIPTNVKFDFYRDKTFAYIPVELTKIDTGNKSIISLVYEVNGTEFIFLGGLDQEEFIPTEPIPKLKINLERGDKIVIKGIKPQMIISDKVGFKFDFYKRINSVTNGTVEYAGPLEVFDPEKIGPKYTDLESFSISFVFCDVTGACGFSRVYNIEKADSNADNWNSDDQKKLEDFVIKETNTNSEYNMSNFDLPYKYINQNFGFQIQYPSNWIILAQDISDSQLLSEDRIMDDTVLNIYPKDEIIRNGITHNLPNIKLEVSDYRNDTKNESVLDVYKAKEENEIIDQFPNGIIFSQTNNAKERKFMLMEVVENDKRYVITFQSFSDEFDRYIDIVNKIFESFKTYRDGHLFTSDAVIRSSQINNDYKYYYNKLNNLTDIPFLKYTNQEYGYKIKFPPYSIEQSFNSSKGNEAFQLLPLENNASTVGFSSAQIYAFKKYETEQTNETLDLELESFSIEGLYQLAQQKILKEKVRSVILSSFDSKIKNITFVGENAYMVELKDFKPQFRALTYEKLLFVLIKDKLFVLSLISTSPQYERASSLFDRMINSFEYQ